MPKTDPPPPEPAAPRPTRRPLRDRPASLKSIEAARDRLPRAAWQMPRPFLVDATSASFRIDGIPVSVEQVTRALGHRQSVRAFRSPLSIRLRAHASILRCVERMVDADAPVRPAHLTRWYAGLSAGMVTGLNGGDACDAASILSRVNAPVARLSTAIADAAQLYADALARPIVPSYNGIVARLLLNLHLSRCGLLPVIVEPTEGTLAGGVVDEPTLLDLLARRYELAGVL